MALDSVLREKFENDPWFKKHKVGWTIINDGRQEISSKKSAKHNLQCLLSNMCAYGAKKWQYKPGERGVSKSSANVTRLLTGSLDDTDCGLLASVFCALAAQLGYDARTREIKQQGYRIVTKPGLVTFDGKTGDASIEDRLCFGNHWVAEYEKLCYDPTFKFQGFSFSQIKKIYMGWYTKEVRDHDSNIFTDTYWLKDQTVSESRDIYLRFIPDFAYTFKKTDSNGRERA